MWLTKKSRELTPEARRSIQTKNKTELAAWRSGGVTENVGPENGGPRVIKRWQIQDRKIGTRRPGRKMIIFIHRKIRFSTSCYYYV